jgi:hypothetical protein
VKDFFHLKTESGWSMDLHPDKLRLAVAQHDGRLRTFDMTPQSS